MLPKKLRMDKASAREVFMRPGGTFSSPNFLLKTAKTTAATTRFAVSVSKKIANTAVLRNRTRRRVYSAIRALLPLIATGFYVAFTVKKGGEKLSQSDIAQEIKTLLKKAGL